MLLASSQLVAANWADKVKFNGFMTTAYHKTDTKTSFNGEDVSAEGTGGITEDGSFNGTKLGLNLTIPVNERITVATQFLSIMEGKNNYNTHLDWAIMSYRVTDELQVRAGKIKFPTGIVNEYRDVGNSYPWIAAPILFYSTEAFGPNNTSESYTGVSGLYEYSLDDTLITAEVLGGEMEGEELYLRNLIGAKLSLNWDDTVNFQATYYRGDMVKMGTPAGIMIVNPRRAHSNLAFGMNADWENIIVYAEWAQTGTEQESTDGTSWYTTLGYQIDDWLPHVTYQSLDKGKNTANETHTNMITAGLRYDLFDNADIKFEYSHINTPKGPGLFEGTAGIDLADKDKNVNMFDVAFDLVF